MKPRSMSLWIFAGRLDRGGAALDGPGAHLVLAGGEEADLIEQLVGGGDEAVARRLRRCPDPPETPGGPPARARRSPSRSGPTAPAPASLRPRASSRTAAGIRARTSASLTLSRTINGRRDRKPKPASAVASSLLQSMRRSGCSSSRDVLQRRSNARSCSLPFSFLRRSRRFSIKTKSVSSSSLLKLSRSRAGFAGAAGDRVGEATHHLHQRVTLAHLRQRRRCPARWRGRSRPLREPGQENRRRRSPRRSSCADEKSRSADRRAHPEP